MDNIRFILILASYNRHKMVRFALESIRTQEYKNWHLIFIDDSSEPPTFGIMEEHLKEEIGSLLATGHSPEGDYDFRVWEKATVYRLNDSIETKIVQGTRHPQGMNMGILDTPGVDHKDVVVIICDDDLMYGQYLTELNEYYKANPDVLYSFCHLAPYNPMIEKPDPSFAERGFWLNRGGDIPYANCIVDASQVTFRRSLFTQHGMRFPSPARRALDAALFSQLDMLGPTRYNGIMGQYKASFPGQLSYRVTASDEYYPTDTELI